MSLLQNRKKEKALLPLIKILTIISLLLVSANAQEFFENKKGTWFFGVDPEEESESKEDNKTEPVQPEDRMKQEQEFMKNIPFNKLDQLSAEEYREMLSKTKDIATMHPTSANVSTYMRLQKFATDKADQFQQKWQLATIQDPDLTYGIATSKFGRNREALSSKEKEKEFLDEVRNNATIVMFYDERAIEDARTQVNVYRMIERQHKLKVSTISIQDNPSYVEQLELKVFPEHWVYYNDGKRASWRRIGGGIQDMETLLGNFRVVFESENEQSN